MTDLGSYTWQEVYREAAPEGAFNYQISFNLPWAVRYALVTLDAPTLPDRWVSGGFIRQNWLRGEYKVDVAFRKINLNQTSLISLQNLENTELIFVPVSWVHDWEIIIEIPDPQTPVSPPPSEITASPQQLIFLGFQ